MAATVLHDKGLRLNVQKYQHIKMQYENNKNKSLMTRYVALN